MASGGNAEAADKSKKPSRNSGKPSRNSGRASRNSQKKQKRLEKKQATKAAKKIAKVSRQVDETETALSKARSECTDFLMDEEKLDACAKFMRDNRYLETYDGCTNRRRVDYFKGDEFVDFVVCKKFKKQHPGLTRKDAVALGNQLLEKGIYFHRSEHKNKNSKSKLFEDIDQLEPDMNHTHMEDSEDALYTWMIDPSNTKTYILSALMVFCAIGVCMIKAWPLWMKIFVWWCSLVMLILLSVLAVIRLIMFAVFWIVGFRGLWLLPNLFEEVDFLDAFTPFVGYGMTTKKGKAMLKREEDRKKERERRRKKAECKRLGIPYKDPEADKKKEKENEEKGAVEDLSEGWVERKGDTKWKKMYFRVTSGDVTLHVSKNHKKEKGRIKLYGQEDGTAVPDETDETRFKVTTAGKTFDLKVETNEIRTKWIEMMEKLFKEKTAPEPKEEEEEEDTQQEEGRCEDCNFGFLNLAILLTICFFCCNQMGLFMPENIPDFVVTQQELWKEWPALAPNDWNETNATASNETAFDEKKEAPAYEEELDDEDILDLSDETLKDYDIDSDLDKTQEELDEEAMDAEVLEEEAEQEGEQQEQQQT